ncbi:hypothetical protein KY284_002966 [Solanum tuberosum]|nr:hypothetical protein KY284_002966 [Solanum tuberosum]
MIHETLENLILYRVLILHAAIDRMLLNFERKLINYLFVGGLGIWRLFDICAIATVAIFYLVGLYHRWVLRRRVRQLAVLPIHPD